MSRTPRTGPAKQFCSATRIELNAIGFDSKIQITIGKEQSSRSTRRGGGRMVNNWVSQGHYAFSLSDEQ
ncbi:unnamed protein product [Victoria cruziana]